MLVLSSPTVSARPSLALADGWARLLPEHAASNSSLLPPPLLLSSAAAGVGCRGAAGVPSLRRSLLPARRAGSVSSR